MLLNRILLLLSGVLLASVSTFAIAGAPGKIEQDEALLKQAGLKVDDSGLLEFFKRRTLSEKDLEKVQKLLRQLGARAFRAREDAAAELIARGPEVVGLLKECMKDGDPEIVRRAGSCLKRIQEKDVSPEVVVAAANLLAARKSPGTVETLLAYLPSVEKNRVAEAIGRALTALAVRDGKVDKTLVAALSDKFGARRSAAAEALMRAGVKEVKEAVRKLLEDPDPAVRLRVASSLAQAQDRDAVPVLIRLLNQVPQPMASQAEEILYRLAIGQSPPMVPLGLTPETQKKCRDTWEAWWLNHKDKVDLARLSRTARGGNYTLLVLLDQGRVMEVDSKKKTLWQIDGFQKPLDVQLLPNERLLVADYDAGQVTERTLKGEIRWHYDVTGPLAAQRLPNGNTFIVTQNQLLELDGDGKEVFKFSPPNRECIMKGMKLPNGESICLTYYDPQLLRVDAHGRVVNFFRVDLGVMKLSGGRIYVQANGNVLIPQHSENRVVEYDRIGKPVWHVMVKAPIAAVRLPNGNTLVTSMDPRPYQAIEFDRAGNEVWHYQADTRITRALRR